MGRDLDVVPRGISSSTGQHHSDLLNVGGVYVDHRQDAWIQYDLGGELMVDLVAISFDQADTIRYNFSVQTAPEDGSSWHDAIKNRQSTKGLGLKEYRFKPRQARFVKLIVHDNNSADKFRAAIDMFKVGHSKTKLKPKPNGKNKKSKTASRRRTR